MQTYRTLNDGETVNLYFGTRDDAHAHAKSIAFRNEAFRIELVDVQSDKEGIVDMLNGEPVVKLLRTWSITSRGGLKEVANGE